VCKVFLYNQSKSLELEYEGRTSDYLFFILFCMVRQLLNGSESQISKQCLSLSVSLVFCLIVSNKVGLLPVAWLMDFMVLGRCLVMCIIYMWSRKFSTVQQSFYFGIQFQGMYLPWVLCAFELLLGGFPFQYLVRKSQLSPVRSLLSPPLRAPQAGIFVAHIFYFFSEVAPQMGWPALRTPFFMYRLLPPEYNTKVDDLLLTFCTLLDFRLFSKIGVHYQQQRARQTHAWGAGRAVGE
jgi:hypothetical protein